MNLAEYYCKLRAEQLSKPCSWQKSYNEAMEADDLDIFYMKKASFNPDGATICLRDNSVVVKSLIQRRAPWIAQN